MCKKAYLPVLAMLVSLTFVPGAGAESPLAPSLSGETGVLRGVSAKGLPRGGMSAVGSGQFFWVRNLLNTSPGLATDNTQWEGQLGASYGIINALEAFLTESNSYQVINAGASRRDVYALGDLNFGLKFGIPLSALISVGADASVRILSSVGAWGYESSATSWGGKALFSVFPPGIPLRAHMNLGYWKDNSSAFSGDILSPIYRYAVKMAPDRMLGTLGFEVPLLNGFLIPLLEYSTEVGSWDKFGENPHRITPGLRVIPRPSIAVTAGVDTSLTSSGTGPSGQKLTLQPIWNAIVSMSYTYLPERAQPLPVQRPPLDVHKKGAVLILEKGKIELSEPILFFEFNETKIMPESYWVEYDERKIMPGSYWLLISVAEILRANPSLKIRIEGHTDNIGGDRYNQLLSQGRADSVRKFLLNQGIHADRMEAVGYGSSRPIADNATLDGRAQNRRVEIVIVSHGPKSR